MELDRLGKIFRALKDGEEIADAAERIGQPWGIADIHKWNERYEKCSDCGRWQRRKSYCGCVDTGTP
jgi:hypothetical protein